MEYKNIDSNFNELGINSQLSKLSSNYELITKISEHILKDYSSPLDELITYVKDILYHDTSNLPTEDELVDISLRIPSLIYFISEGLNELGLKEDLALIMRNEAFNNCHLEASGTVDVKKSKAELSCMQELIIHRAHKRAYKLLELKVQYAQDLLQSVKKKITLEIAKYDLSKIDPNNGGG
jgi:hypothetical protein